MSKIYDKILKNCKEKGYTDMEAKKKVKSAILLQSSRTENSCYLNQKLHVLFVVTKKACGC